jgi:alpha-beta hydrolase superfamily lysophospholipase
MAALHQRVREGELGRLISLFGHTGSVSIVLEYARHHPDEAVALPDKEFHEYPGAYTNLLSDTVSDGVLTDIGAWLDRHVAAQSAMPTALPKH